MVARAPFVRSFEGAHRHPLMEAARGDGVVELAVGFFRTAPVVVRRVGCAPIGAISY